MKKIISIILAIVTIVSLFTFTASAGDTVEHGDENLKGEHPWAIYFEYMTTFDFDTTLTLSLFDNVTQRIVEVTKDTEGAESFEIERNKDYATTYSLINSNSFETDRYIPVSFKVSIKIADWYLAQMRNDYQLEDDEYFTYSLHHRTCGCQIYYDGKAIPLNVSFVGYTDEDEKPYGLDIYQIHEEHPIVDKDYFVSFYYRTKNDEDGTYYITDKDRCEGSFLFVNDCYNELNEHDFGEWTTDDTIQNCLNQSKWVRYCKQCGKEEVKYITNDCHFVTNTYVIPTCKSSGYRTYICSVCDKEKVEYFDKLEHEYNDWVEYPATCTSASYKTRTCKNCDYTETIYSGKANGHNYEVESIINPTYDTYGYCVFKCKDCNDTYVNIISKLTKEEPTIEETTEEITTKEETTIEETTVAPEQTTEIVEDTTATETKKTSKNIFDYIADFFKWLVSLFN